MVSIDDDFSDPDDLELSLDATPPAAPPSASAQAQAKKSQQVQGLSKTPYKQMQPEEYKHYDTIYPIYFDAKAPHCAGGRRVPKTLALEWPLAESIAGACGRLGVQTVFEPMKCHPADWANPGRVRVLLKNEDGTPKNPKFKNKKQLLHAISPLLRPFQPSTSAASTSDPSASASALPAIEERLPAHSPAVSHGILESATSGKGPMGGMGNMFGNMLGGGGGAGGAAAEEEDKPAEVKKTPQKPKMKKIHAKRR